ncbi:hypothetical protein K502DRAFT_355677 [Neoconidiobolus thromboides FSU 785]|nr:hypothetical protein K502DRAFT_355677 [Neoconidiobolus thromboides FSU 785]
MKLFSTNLILLTCTLLLPIVTGIAPNQSDAKPNEAQGILSADVLEKAMISTFSKNEDNTKANLSAEDVEAMNLALTMEYLKFSFLQEYLSSGSFINNRHNGHSHDHHGHADKKSNEIYVADEARNPTEKLTKRSKVGKPSKLDQSEIQNSSNIKNLKNLNIASDTNTESVSSSSNAESMSTNSSNESMKVDSNAEIMNSKIKSSESVNCGADSIDCTNSSSEKENRLINNETVTDSNESLIPKGSEMNENSSTNEGESRVELDNKMLNTRDGLRRIREHTNNYINVLTKAIRLLGGNPLQKCNYNFGSATSSLSPADNMLMLSRAFEAMTIQVYNGFQGIMSNGKLREILSSMTSVQASHLAFLNMHARQELFSESFDTIMSARQGLSYFKKYISSCPFAVQGGTFRTLNLRPESGPIGSKLMVGVMNIRNDLGVEQEADTKSDIKSDASASIDNTIPTPILADNNNSTKMNFNSTTQDTRSATANEYCLFISGTQQIFSDYNRGCIVPNNLPGGIAFVHLVRDRVRITPTKIDHVLAGPAAFDVIPQSGIFNPSFPITNDELINNPEDLTRGKTTQKD